MTKAFSTLAPAEAFSTLPSIATKGSQLQYVYVTGITVECCCMYRIKALAPIAYRHRPKIAQKDREKRLRYLMWVVTAPI